MGIASTTSFVEPSPSFMIAPLPNCFSICEMAKSKACSFSLLFLLIAAPTEDRASSFTVRYW